MRTTDCVNVIPVRVVVHFHTGVVPLHTLEVDR